MEILDKTVRIWVITGEVSGDQHAAGVIAELRKLVNDLRVWGIGGAALEAVGAQLTHRIDELAVMGFSEVVGSLKRIWRIFREQVSLIGKFRPDVVILVDFPDFNLRLAKKVKQLGIPVIYYISPQLWAWRRGRVKIVRRCVERMLVIFPFEEQFYGAQGVDAVYTGYPIPPSLRGQQVPPRLKESLGIATSVPLIGLLPGSRNAEVKRLLPVMLQAAKLLVEALGEVAFCVPRAATVSPQVLHELVSSASLPLQIIDGQAHRVMAGSDCLVVASGTASLEAAYVGTPMVVVYRVSRFSYLLATWLVHVPYIAMPNLLAGKQLVPELVQHACTGEAIAEEVKRYLEDQAYYQRTKRDLCGVRALLSVDNAYAKAADEIVSLLVSHRRSSRDAADAPRIKR